MRHRFTSPSYTREQMVELFGEDQIIRLEREVCEPTNRVMHSETEFMSCIRALDCDGNDKLISAYYYQDDNDLNNIDDFYRLIWEIDDYGVN